MTRFFAVFPDGVKKTAISQVKKFPLLIEKIAIAFKWGVTLLHFSEVFALGLAPEMLKNLSRMGV